ncbi:MAG: hypothetical protein NVS2B4_08440 [Ramlibacter sp.]
MVDEVDIGKLRAVKWKKRGAEMKKPPGCRRFVRESCVLYSGRLDLSTAGWVREPEVAKKEDCLLVHGNHSSTGIAFALRL